ERYLRSGTTAERPGRDRRSGDESAGEKPRQAISDGARIERRPARTQGAAYHSEPETAAHPQNIACGFCHRTGLLDYRGGVLVLAPSATALPRKAVSGHA